MVAGSNPAVPTIFFPYLSRLKPSAGRHPPFLLEGIAHRHRTGAGFRGVCEISRFISEMFGVGEKLPHVVEARDDIHAGGGALVNRGTVAKCLANVVGAALGFYVKEIHASKLGNRHVSAQFSQQDASGYSFRVSH